MPSRRTVPVRQAIRSARIAMFAQSVLGIASPVFLLILINSVDDDFPGYLAPLLVLSLLLAVVLFACAVMVSRRLAWVRGTVIAIETLVAVDGLVGLVLAATGGSAPTGAQVIPLVFSSMVLQPMLRRDVRAWFAGVDPVA